MLEDLLVDSLADLLDNLIILSTAKGEFKTPFKPPLFWSQQHFNWYQSLSSLISNSTIVEGEIFVGGINCLVVEVG